MKNATLVLMLLACTLCRLNAQYTTTYETSFNYWQPNQGWVLLNNDSLPISVGPLSNSGILGVGIPGLEVMDYMLGISNQYSWLQTPPEVMGNCDKIMISPPINLGSNPYCTFYSRHKVGSYLTAYVLANPNDTTLNGLGPGLLNSGYDGYNVLNLHNWANTTVRIAFRVQGVNTYGIIDNVKVIDKTGPGSIPDSCFRTYLQSIIPSAFVGNDLDFLNPAAINLTQIVYPNNCIQSLEGLQYFPNLRKINLKNGFINYIPPVPLYYLDSIKIGNNLLSFLPDMPRARSLCANENLLHIVPDIFNNYCDSLALRNNSIYDCLSGTNRFVYGDLSGNIGVNFGSFTYYYMTYDHPMYPGNGPSHCKDEIGYVYGKVYYDANQNGTFDTTEAVFPSQKIDFVQGNYVYTNAYGGYMFGSDTGAINMNVTDLPNYFTCVNPLNDHMSPLEIIQHDFRIVANASVKDLEIHLNAIRSGNTVNFTLSVKNNGTALTNGVVKMYLPPTDTLLGLQQGNIVNDTLVWTVNVLPLQTQNNFVQVRTNTSAALMIAEVICPGDIYLPNNTDTALVPAMVPVSVHPHDPNSKTVNTPQVAPGFSDYLYYTISFENTGTGDAHRVLVRDYLSSDLDASTFEMLGSSHPCVLDWGGNNAVNFVFYPITLTPTSIDSIHSHGNLWFRIKPAQPIQAGEQISNSAAIYFDNEDVVNTDICLVWAGQLNADFTITDSIQCGSENTVFTDVSPGTVHTRQWFFTGATPNTSVAAAPQVHYASSGLYNVTLIVSTNEYTDTIVKSVYITVDSLPLTTITVTGNTSFCLGDSVLLTAPTGNGYTYHWNNNQTTQSIVAKNSYYYLTVTEPSGCSAFGYKSLTVYNPIPNITTPGNCESPTVYLNAGAGFAAYLWSNGKTTAIDTVSQYGVYTVRVTDSHGCIGRDTFNFIYHTNPTPVITGDTVSCSNGNSLWFLPQGYAAYQWSNNSQGYNYSYVSGNNNISVTVTDTVGCKGVATMHHSSLPAPFTNITGDRSVCKGMLAQMDAGPGFTNYWWSSGDSTRTTYVSNSGTYTVTITNSYQCSAAANYTITVHDIYNLNVSAVDTSFCPGQFIHLNAQYNQGVLTAPTAGCTTQQATVGTGTTLEPYNGYSTPGLLSNYKKGTHSQMLYHDEELQAVMGGPALITSLGFEIGTFNSSAMLQNLTIKVGLTADERLDFNGLENLTEVFYAASWQPVVGWNTINLQTPFYWDGTSNLVVELCNYNPGTFGNLSNKVVCSTTSFFSYLNKWDTTAICSNNNFNIIYSSRPNIRFNYCTPAGPLSPIEHPTLTWYTSTGSANITDTHAAYTTANSSTITTFVFTITDTSGCADADSVVFRAGTSNPVLITATHNYLCTGDTVQLCATATTGNYHWNTGDTSTCLKVSSHGVYSVSFDDGQGCVSSNSINIHQSAADSLVLTASALAFCAGDSVTICATAGLNSYLWNNSATGTCITRYTGGNVTVVVYDANGCAKYDSVSLQVYPVTPITVSATSTTVCPNDSIEICATPGAASYVWNNLAATQCVYAAAAGTYWTSATDVNNCTTESNHLTVTAGQQPPVITANGATLSTTSAGTAWQWYLNDTLISGATSASYTAQTSGNYSLQLTDSNACQSFSNTVNVVINSYAVVPATATVVRTFPNPFNGKLTVEVKKQSMKEINLTVTDIFGQQVYNKSEPVFANIYLQQLDLNALATGVYFITIKTEGETVVKKITKE